MTLRISDIDICNQALGWLGQNPISSFADDSKPAALCKLNYPIMRAVVLAERSWTFNTARYTSVSQAKPGWGNGFLHPIPENWLAVYRVYSELFDGGVRGSSTFMPEPGIPADWVVEAGGVIANYPTVYMWGLISIEDANKFSVMFTQALAARLAFTLAVPLTKDTELQQSMLNVYNSFLVTAGLRDGQQGRNEHINNSSLVKARAGY